MFPYIMENCESSIEQSKDCQKTKKKSKKQAGKSSRYLNVLRGSLKKWTNEWHRIVIEHLIPPLKDSKVLIPLRQF